MTQKFTKISKENVNNVKKKKLWSNHMQLGSKNVLFVCCSHLKMNFTLVKG